MAIKRLSPLATPFKRVKAVQGISSFAKIQPTSKIATIKGVQIGADGLPTFAPPKALQATKFDVLTQKSEFIPIALDQQSADALQQAGWQPVASSNVVAVKRENKELWVLFSNNSVYVWRDVNARRFTNILRSASKGRYVWFYLYGLHLRKVR